MAFSLTYQDYVSSHPADATGGSEGGQGTSSLMPEDKWDDLSDSAKWSSVGNGIVLVPGDPRYDDLAKQLGVTNGRQIIGGTWDESVPIDSKYLVDPSRVSKQAGALFTPDENLTPFAQKTDTSSNWFHEMGPGLMIVGAMLSGGALASAYGVAGTAVTGAEATAAGGIASGADIAGTAGAAGAAGTAGAGATGAEIPAEGMPPGADVGPPSGLAPDPGVTAPPGADIGPPGPEPTPGVTPPGADVGPPADLAPGPSTSTGAPVDDVSVPAQQPSPVVDHSVPAPGSDGLINGARSTVNSVGTWYNNLSPASRFVLGTVISQGARGLMGAAAQRQTQQAAVDAENRHRQDVIRQGQVPILPPGTFTYKPPGG